MSFFPSFLLSLGSEERGASTRASSSSQPRLFTTAATSSTSRRASFFLSLSAIERVLYPRPRGRERERERERERPRPRPSSILLLLLRSLLHPFASSTEKETMKEEALCFASAIILRGCAQPRRRPPTRTHPPIHPSTQPRTHSHRHRVTQTHLQQHTREERRPKEEEERPTYDFQPNRGTNDITVKQEKEAPYSLIHSLTHSLTHSLPTPRNVMHMHIYITVHLLLMYELSD